MDHKQLQGIVTIFLIIFIVITSSMIAYSVSKNNEIQSEFSNKFKHCNQTVRDNEKDGDISQTDTVVSTPVAIFNYGDSTLYVYSSDIPLTSTPVAIFNIINTPTFTPTLTPTLVPNIITPTPMPGERIILGFSNYSYSSINKYKDIISEIASCSGNVNGYGNILGEFALNEIQLANDSNILPLLLLTNFFEGSFSQMMLGTPENRKNCIMNTIDLIKTKNCRGVNIDFEGIYPNDRENFIVFLKELHDAFEADDYVLTVSVPAKTFDLPSDSWHGAYDYKNIAQYADQILIMTYDEHYSCGEAGPVASIGWVRRVADYALTVIPKEKILLGLSAYGYDWDTGIAKAYSVRDCYEVAKQKGAIVQWNYEFKVPFYSYWEENNEYHNVWFEDQNSIEYKLNLVNEKNLGGIGIWRLGLETSEYMDAIRLKFKARRLYQ